MKTMLTKFEKGFIAIAFLLVVMFITLFTQVSLKPKAMTPFDAASFINYQMGRATDAYSEYTLSGRDVNHVFEGLKPAAAAAKTSGQTQADAKKKTEVKKKDELAKKTKQAPVARVAQVKTVPHSNASPRINSELAPQSVSASNSATDYSAHEATATADPAALDPSHVADKTKKTFAQWRALILASPTRENLTSFIEAYRKNQITTTEYQAMAQDLLDQPDEKYKGLGIMALRAHPSLDSLSQLTHVQTLNLSEALKTYLGQALGAYMQSQNIAILNQALQTQDKTLIGKTLTLLNTNLPKMNQGDFSTVIDARNLRSTDKTDVNMAQFKVLIPALTAITTSQDPQLTPLAQQATNYIQSAPATVVSAI